MGVWETVEAVVVETLEHMTWSSAPLMATVKGYTPRDRRSVVADMSGQVLPAAYVMMSGRHVGDKAAQRSGPAEMSVLLGTGSLRGDEDLRAGGADAKGMFMLAEQVALSLQDLRIGDEWRLFLIDERSGGGSEHLAIWEQRYEIRRYAERAAVTFGGVALAGSDSEVHVEPGSLRRATSMFSFPGIDGVFERDLGLRDRDIIWRGQLRAPEDASLSALESAIESELRSGQVAAIVDACGRVYESCVARSFERRGLRVRDELSGDVLQDFVLTFAQLNG